MDRATAMREAAEAASAGPWNSPADAAYDAKLATAGADAERARVVAWLREEAKELGPSSYHRAQRDILLFEADAIERGEHWPQPKGADDES